MQILSSSKGSVDLYSGFRSLTLDIIFDYTYGEDAGALKYPSFAHPILVNTEMVIQAGAITRHLPLIFVPRLILLSIFPDGVAKTLKSRAKLFVERKAQVQQTGERETIFSRIIDVEDASLRSLIEEGDNVLFAGTDTVANVCMMGCFYVHNNPEILEKVRAELKNAWQDPSSRMSYEDLEKLPYLAS